MSHLKIVTTIRAIIAFFLLSVLVTSCEKEVHINLSTSDTKLVVQGAIETHLPPYVVLTSTMGFFSHVDLSTLQGSFIHGADIKVSDGMKTVTLREYSIDSVGSKFYAYTIDTANLADIMLGEEGKFYTLTINYGSKTYSSVTKIPFPKNIDTLWYGAPVFKNSKTPAHALQLFANYTDPDTLGNYVRYFTERNHYKFFPVGIFSDEAVNGKTIGEIALFAGYDDSVNVKGDSLRYFYPGDTVVVKWAEIDKGVFNFWNSFIYAQNAVGNPFASPINPQTNIKNGALGVWAGYGSVLNTIYIPR